MAARLESHHRKCGTQRPELGYVLAIQAAGPFLPAVPQAGTACALGAVARTFAPFNEDFQILPTLADQPVPHPATKAAPVGHDMQGFKHAGLAGTVVAGQ